MNFEKNDNESNAEKIPEGRELGEKVSNEDLISIGALSGTVALVLEPEKLTEEGNIPSYTWLQEIDVAGNVIAEPHMGPPVRLQVMTGSTFFEEVKKHSS